MNCSINRPNRLARPSLASELDRFFRTVDPSVAFGPRRTTPASFPPIDVREDEHAFYIESDVPGYTMDNLDISITGNELTIRGTHETNTTTIADETAEHEETHEEHRMVYHCRERVNARPEFSRRLRIGVPIDHANVAASLEHGVLTITLPKAESAKPRKIEVAVK